MLFSCQQTKKYTPKGLTKLSVTEIIERAESGDFGSPDVVLKNEQGKVIAKDSLRKMANFDNFWTDPYANEEGIVVEAIMRKATPEDKILRAKLNEIFSRGPDVEMVAIDCADKQNFLQTVFESDQGVRKGDIDPKLMKETDQKNLTKIVSFLEKCGVPSLEEVDDVQMAAIWAVLQHNSLRYRKKYLPLLEDAAKKGDIDKGVIVMIKDRNLMEEGKPQIYGTQIQNGRLYTLYQPEFVNKRRADVGLGPIQEYLDRWNIVFDVPQK